jgi:hypothetical protein
MTIRGTIATTLLQYSRVFGRMLGCQLAVETSEHSIQTTMEVPNQDDRAWDPGLFKHGNLFVAGYANPVKPSVKVNKELETPDVVEVDEGDPAKMEDTDDDPAHAQLISSARYRKYMRQDLISQLLTPKEQWRLIAYGVMAVAGMQLLTVAVILWATGSFA